MKSANKTVIGALFELQTIANKKPINNYDALEKLVGMSIAHSILRGTQEYESPLGQPYHAGMKISSKEPHFQLALMHAVIEGLGTLSGNISRIRKPIDQYIAKEIKKQENAINSVVEQCEQYFSQKTPRNKQMDLFYLLGEKVFGTANAQEEIAWSNINNYNGVPINSVIYDYVMSNIDYPEEMLLHPTTHKQQNRILREEYKAFCNQILSIKSL